MLSQLKNTRNSLLCRYQDRDGVVKAWAYLDQELVLRQARILDQTSQDQRGPLHGVAIGIKDVMSTRDMPTQYGSPIYEGHQPGLDLSAVGILRAAGALIFGKTTTTEFTVTNSGPKTANLHDPARTPGGSSCGSAAAVADMQVPLSLGVQTGGSVIRPAAYCGTFAMKPTYNAVSTEGQKVFSTTFDTIDVFGIDDDQPPEQVSLKDATVALVKTPMWSHAGSGTIEAMRKTAAILPDHGVEVEEVSLSDDLGDADTLKRSQKAITNAEAKVAFLKEYRMDKVKLDASIRHLVEAKPEHAGEERLQALDMHARLRTMFDKTAANYSVIIAPSAPDEASLGLDDMGSPIFNTLWTGLHVPVVHIPAFAGSHGMPVGVSLIAGRSRDQHLLQMSRLLDGSLMADGGWRLAIEALRANFATASIHATLGSSQSRTVETT